MATYGSYWQHMATYGNLVQLLASHGNLWQLLVTDGGFWQLLTLQIVVPPRLGMTKGGIQETKTGKIASKKYNPLGPPPPPPVVSFFAKKWSILH